MLEKYQYSKNGDALQKSMIEKYQYFLGIDTFQVF